MSSLITQGAAPALAPRSQVLAAATVDPNAIMGGIGPSFGILTFRGKVFRVKYRGEELALMMDPPGPGMPSPGPKPFCDVVIVSSSPAISKIYYEDAYQEGDTDAPDCFSTNGIHPDPASPKKQAELCATCPKNIWGSRANANTGAKGKACQDSKRLAVVPLDDMKNERLGGPLLLRVPPASLQNMGNYNTYLQNQGHVFFSVGTRMQFDPEAAYPKLTFYPIKGLGDGEATLVKELQNDPRVIRMLQEAVDQVRDAGVGGLPGTAAPVTGAVPAGAPQPAVYVAPQQQAPPVVAAPAVPVPSVPPPIAQPAVPLQPAVPVTPVGQAQSEDDLKIPGFLTRPAGQPVPAQTGFGLAVAQQPVAQQPVAQQPVAQVQHPVVPTTAPPPPQTIAFVELEPAAMGALAASDPPGFQKYLVDLAAWKAAGGGKKTRGKNKVAAQPAPSPAPTAVAQPVAQPVAVVPTPPPIATVPATAPPTPPTPQAAAVAGPLQDAALAHLDETLLKAL